MSRQFFRRQRHSPDVSRLIEFNTAVGGLLWIDIHDPSRSISICQIDMHLDFHVNAERDGGRNQFSEYFWRYERPIEKAEEPFSRCQHCSASLSRGTQRRVAQIFLAQTEQPLLRKLEAPEPLPLPLGSRCALTRRIIRRQLAAWCLVSRKCARNMEHPRQSPTIHPSSP